MAPKDKARIRIQLPTTHTKEQLGKAITTFVKVGTVLIVIQKKIAGSLSVFLTFYFVIKKLLAIFVIN